MQRGEASESRYDLANFQPLTTGLPSGFAMVARLTPGGSKRKIVLIVVLSQQQRRRLTLSCLTIDSVHDLKVRIVSRAATSGHRHFVPEQPDQVALCYRGARLQDFKKLFEADITNGCLLTLVRV